MARAHDWAREAVWLLFLALLLFNEQVQLYRLIDTWSEQSQHEWLARSTLRQQEANRHAAAAAAHFGPHRRRLGAGLGDERHRLLFEYGESPRDDDVLLPFFYDSATWNDSSAVSGMLHPPLRLARRSLGGATGPRGRRHVRSEGVFTAHFTAARPAPMAFYT